MKIRSLIIVGIALLGTACATLAGKSGQGVATNGSNQPDVGTRGVADGSGSAPGFGSERQGPGLNGMEDRGTGLQAPSVRVVGGQLVRE